MSEPIFTYDFDDFPEAQRNVFFDLTLNLNNNSKIMHADVLQGSHIGNVSQSESNFSSQCCGCL